MPVRLVRGDPSPEELAALVTVLAAAAAGDGDGGSALTARAASQWSSPRRMVRLTYPHGPGAWRASALPS